jgi:hypothetical protein
VKEVEHIQQLITQIPEGVLFSASTIGKGFSYDHVRQVLSRLVKKNEIVRVTRGTYVRPKKVPYLGKVLPGSEEIIRDIFNKTGEIIVPHGAEAVYRLNLSTQVPMQSIFYTTGNTRQITVGKLALMLRHVSPSKLVKPGTIIGLVISALWYLGKDQVNSEVIKKIKERLTAQEFNELFNMHQQMPHWMVAAFNLYQKEHFNRC